MISKMSVKIGLRMRYQSFVSAKANHLIRKAFYTLYNIYFDNMSKLNYFVNKQCLNK
jgi:hypothetical protein